MSFSAAKEKSETPSLLSPGKTTMYRVHVGRRIYGPIRIEDFKRVPGFTLQTRIAPFGTEDWKAAYQIINLHQYFQKSVDNSYTRHASAQDIKSQLVEEAPVEEKPESKPISKRQRAASFLRRIPVPKRLPSMPRMLVMLVISVSVLTAGWVGLNALTGQKIEKQTRQWAIHLIDKALVALNA